MRRISLFLVLLISVLSLAACTEALPTAEEIVERMETAREGMNDAHATVAFDFTSPEQSGRIVVEGWMQKTGETDAAGKPVGRMRVEVLEASEAAMVGTIAVSDGATFWLYNPAENTAITGEAGQMKDAMQATPAGAATMLTDIIAQGLDAVNLEVLGTEQVAGNETWKVLVTPKSETTAQLQLDGIIEGTMWVDTELALPLKLAVDARDFGQGTMEVQSIETNSGLNAEIFAFTPPAGTTIIQAEELMAQMSQRAPTAATIEEARTSVSFVLREPTYIPAGMTLIEVRVVGTSTVILNYSGDTGSMSVVQSNEDVGRDREPPTGSVVEEVTVDGVPATLISGNNGQGSLLRWEVDGIRYVIAGTLSGDEAIAVGEGLE
ncbi:DUF4367 domain-containing protein [Candidatus Chloroploca asiatica]|uniref:DUF4367 domain-containing protein n=1 Tax=Candidatus Chloroploca asiatica TaxID=1506545 RepID=A0A2H3KSD6_9CHLR|nr:DUF4367 domain-containing protein [Candidatus Chloroploca asiatica]PDV98155.1 hypothetical protein A9Q02_03485 [Candidatus Chloroploca asiatica]